MTALKASGRSLWSLARNGMGKPKPAAAGPWLVVLQHVRRVRANLKPVGREEEEVSGDAWPRALKGKLLGSRSTRAG